MPFINKPLYRQENTDDARFARNSKDQAKIDVARAKRPKNGGRKKGSRNKKTLEKIQAAERDITATNRGKKLAVDYMDEMIIWFRNLVGALVPFEANGAPREGFDPKLWFRAVEAFQGFLNMRAPYQSARLSAVAVVPAPSRQRTMVSVTLLNEHGESVYEERDPESETDADDEDSVIEHEVGDGEGSVIEHEAGDEEAA